MIEPGTLYVRPIEGGQWKDVGHVSEDGLTYVDQEYRPVLFGHVQQFKAPHFSALNEAFQSVTVAFKGLASAFRILAGLPPLRRPERISSLRSAYRQKRGRRRFR